MLSDLQLLEIAILIGYPHSLVELKNLIKAQENKFGIVIYTKIVEVLQSLTKLKTAHFSKVVAGQDRLKKAGSLEWYQSSTTDSSIDVQNGTLLDQLKYLVGYTEETTVDPIEIDSYDIRTIRG